MTKSSTRINYSNLISTDTSSFDKKKYISNRKGPSVQTMNVIRSYSRSVRGVKIDKENTFLISLN